MFDKSIVYIIIIDTVVYNCLHYVIINTMKYIESQNRNISFSHGNNS